MKEINLSISAAPDKDNQVVLTAKFDTLEEAVRFHSGLARMCNDSLPSKSQWLQRIAINHRLLLPKNA